MQKRTPGIPGVFSDLQWVDSPDFGDEPEDRRIGSLYDVDPAPLAKVLGAILGLTDDNLTERMHELADDDRDGPIHIVHLLGACEYAAIQTGGEMPGAAFAPGDFATQLLTSTVSGGALPALVGALREGGFPAATKLARQMEAELRFAVLDSLLHYWMAPISGLCIDLTDEKLRKGR
jgi:hypothetical protein